MPFGFSGITEQERDRLPLVAAWVARRCSSVWSPVLRGAAGD